MTAPTPGQTVGPFFGYALPYDGGPDAGPEEPSGRDPPARRRARRRGRAGAGRAAGDLAGRRAPAIVPRVGGSLRRDGYTFTGWGRASTDNLGQYSFTTVEPGAPFIALTLFARGLMNRLFTRIYLPGATDPFLDFAAGRPPRHPGRHPRRRRPAVRRRPAGRPRDRFPHLPGTLKTMSDAFVYDAVRTPFGRFDGALAKDAAGRPRRHRPARDRGADPRPRHRRGGRGGARPRQRRRRGQPQRRPDGRAARRLPGVGAGLDDQPAVRVRSRRGHVGVPPDRDRRRVGRGRRRRRVDDACAVGAAEAGPRVPGAGRDGGVDDARLAAGEPGDAEGVDGVARRVERAAARRVRRLPGAAGRVRGAVAPARARRVGGRVLRRPDGAGRRPDPRRGHPGGHVAGEAGAAEAVVPAGRDDHRGQRVAAQRRRVGGAGGLGLGVARPRPARAGSRAGRRPRWSRSGSGTRRSRRRTRRSPGPASTGPTSARSS